MVAFAFCPLVHRLGTRLLSPPDRTSARVGLLAGSGAVLLEVQRLGSGRPLGAFVLVDRLRAAMASYPATFHPHERWDALKALLRLLLMRLAAFLALLGRRKATRRDKATRQAQSAAV
jgi:hypothetical protein